jgi:hypothetical protein
MSVVFPAIVFTDLSLLPQIYNRRLTFLRRLNGNAPFLFEFTGSYERRMNGNAPFFMAFSPVLQTGHL